MGDDLSLKERDAVRTPMQWSDEAQAGFSSANKTVHRVIAQGIYDYRLVNVEAQRRDPNSLLNWTAQMIRLRKECPEIGWDDWQVLATGSPGLLALRYDWRGNSLAVVHNFTEKPCEVRLNPRCAGDELLVNLLVEEESWVDEQGRHRIALEAYDYRWYRVGGLNYIIQRQKV